MSTSYESNEDTNGIPLLISTDILIVVVATSVLSIALIILTTVLVVVGVYYCKKKRTSRSTDIHSQSRGGAALKLPSIPAREASKFFVVESSVDPPPNETSNGIPNFPSLVMSSIKRKQTGTSSSSQSADLQVISQPIVLEMECNPNYHQLATEGTDGGTDTPISSASPMLTIVEEPEHSNNEVSINMSNDHVRNSHALCSHTYSNPSITLTPSESPIGNSNTNRTPVPPRRQESLVNSYTRTTSETAEQHQQQCKFIPRACSDNQIRRHKDDDCDLYGPIYSELSNRLSTSVVKVKTVSKSNIKMIKNLGMGQFGLVHLGKTVGLSQLDLEMGTSEDRSQSFEVAIKVLRPNPPQSEKQAFEREVKYMSHFKHSNVVQLIAVCWGEEPFIVMEYMRHGDLQDFLQRFNTIGGESTSLITKSIMHSKLVSMATQIADAMMYLASRNFVHRDLATRNCLVGDNYNVKVADFGLSRNLYDSCYYRFQGSAMLPIRWMANECFYGRFSEKSDVWAFGVTMWEIFSLCKQKPYSDKTDQQLVVETLRNARTMLEKPQSCHDAVYEIMKQCMLPDADKRWNFEHVFSKLSQIS